MTTEAEAGGADSFDRSGPVPAGPRRLSLAVLGIGTLAAVLAASADPGAAAAAARQDWTPFVLVAGLLLLGLTADVDGLFDAGGTLVARVAGGGFSLLVWSASLVAVTTAVLNLDTSVAFLTPVLVLAARRRRVEEAAFLYLSVFLANGASLLLPGSNLTNLIVLGGRPVAGHDFAWHMLPSWLAASVAVTAVLAFAFRRSLAVGSTSLKTTSPIGRPVPRYGAGLVGVVVAVAAMVALSSSALALVVFGTGLTVAAWRVGRRELAARAVGRTIDAPVLTGLFGLAVGLGSLGRAWSGPEWLLRHVSGVGAAAVGAVLSAAANNLPAASLLAARPPPDPYALLIGLNLGPNLAVTGALSAVLWIAASERVGASPSASRFSRLGIAVTIVSMAAALGALHAR